MGVVINSEFTMDVGRVYSSIYKDLLVGVLSCVVDKFVHTMCLSLQ